MDADRENNADTTEKAMPIATHVAITVRSQDGKVTYYKIKRDTQIKKLLKSYCHKYFLDYQTIQFYLEGERFIHNKTPNELGLEDDEVEIEAMAHQLGGA